MLRAWKCRRKRYGRGIHPLLQGWQRRRRRRGFPGFMQRLREPEQLGSHASTCDANSTPSNPGGQRPTRRSRRPPPSAADRLRRLPTDGYYAARRDRLPMPLRYKGSSDVNRPATFRKTSCMFARGFSREASGPPSPGEPPASAEDHLAIRKMKALLSKQQISYDKGRSPSQLPGYEQDTTTYLRYYVYP